MSLSGSALTSDRSTTDWAPAANPPSTPHRDSPASLLTRYSHAHDTGTDGGRVTDSP